MNDQKRKSLDECSDESERFESQFERFFADEGEESARVRLVAEITDWLQDIAKQGRFIPLGSADRRAFRSLLERWNTRLRRQSRSVEDIASLADFDANAGIVLTGNCPYPGLGPYTELQRSSFCGREALVSESVAHLEKQGNRILLIIGASGSGKSSLAMAGILPRLTDLHHGEWLFGPRLTPGAHPLAEFSASIAKAVGHPDQASEIERDLAAKPSEALSHLAELSQRQPLMLLIDQFEEMLTMCRDSGEQSVFAQVLCALSSPHALAGGFCCRLLLTLRTDHLQRLETDNALKPLHTRLIGEGNSYQLSAILINDIKRAIKEPADKVGLRFVPATLIDQLASQTAGLANGLPLLQFALRRLWDTRPRNETGEPLDLITEAMVRALPDVQHALGSVAENIFEDKFSDSQKPICDRLLQELVVLDENFEEPLRRRRNEAEIRRVLQARFQKSGDVDRVIGDFVEAHLLRRFGEGPDCQIEVAHEALLRRWNHIYELLNGAEVKERLHRIKQIGREAHDWAAHDNKDDYLKLKGEPLLRANAYAEEGWLAEGELTAYVEACSRQETAERLKEQRAKEEKERADAAERAREAAERESLKAIAKAEARRAEVEKKAAVGLRRQRKALLVVSLIAAFAAIIAVLQYQGAQNKAKIAQTLQLAAAAIANLNIDPELSVLLALQSVSFSRSVSKSVLPEAEDALHRSVQSSRIEISLSGHTDRIVCIAFSPDGMRLATASRDGTAKVWDAISGVELFTLSRHTGGVYGVAFSPDGKRLATASWDGTGTVWDAIKGEELFTLSGHTQEVMGVAFSPDGKRLATASYDKTAKIWDAISGKELFTLPGHTRGVLGVTFSPDSMRLATASWDRTAKVWDAISGMELFTLFGHTGGVYGVAFSPDGKRLATAGYDKTAKVWDAISRKELLTISGHTGEVTSVAFSPDSMRLATASLDGTVKVWNSNSIKEKELFTLSGHTNGVYGVAFSPDGKRLATASQDETAKIWNAASVEEILTLSAHTGEVRRFAFNPNGTRLATASRGGTAEVWDTTSEKKLLTLKGHAKGSTREILSIAFSPDGKRLATASSDGTAKVWDAFSERKELLTLSGHTGEVFDIAFSPPDGALLATASDDKTAKVWDAISGKEIFTLYGHAREVRSVNFSPDGTQLATASWDKTAKVWDAIYGREIFTLSGHTGEVLSIAFSRDGTRLATGSWDGTAKVWDAITGECILNLSGNTRGVFNVAFSPDGKRLATSGGDGIVRSYALDVEDLVSLALTRVTRHLSPRECEEFLRVKVPRTAQAIRHFVDGKHHALAGDIINAISSFQEALKLDPQLRLEPKAEANRLAAQAFAKKAYCQWQQGNDREAIGHWDKAVSLDSNHWTKPGPEFYSELAIAFWRKKDINHAIEFVNKAIEADPNYGHGYILLGNIRLGMKQYQDAANAFSKVKENDPEHEYAIELLGTTLFDKLFNYEEAYQVFKIARKLYPTNKNHALDFVEATFATERFDEACKLAQNLLTESVASLAEYEKLVMRFFIVSSLALQGKTSETIIALDNFIEYYESVIDTYYSMWSFSGTGHFLEDRVTDENIKKILLKLIDIINKPNPNIRVEGIQALFPAVR